MQISLSLINKKFSTTKLCFDIYNKYMNNYIVNFPQAGIENSTIPKKKHEKFNTYIFLPKNTERKSEGGLRKKGYLKFNYKVENGQWWACNFRWEKLFKVSPPEDLDIKLDTFPKINNVIYIPLISIITVVYNNKEKIEKTINSVINQNYPNIEYIIIDGNSTDGTVDIIKKYDQVIDFWVSEPDEGISDAFNKGLILALGSYIQILNSGDTFLNEDILKDIIKDFLNKDVVAYQALTDTGKVFPSYRYEVTELNTCDIVKKIQNAQCAHQATFISKVAYLKTGLYNSYSIRMDFDLFMRLQKFFNIYCFNKPIVLYLTDGISSKFKNRLKFKLEEYMIINKDECNIPFSFKVKFFINLPVYLIKKFLSTLYYKYFR